MNKKVKLILTLFLSLVIVSGSRRLTEIGLKPPLAEGIRLAVIGDFGQHGRPELQVSNMIKGWNVDTIVTVGDNSYPRGEEEELQKNIFQYYDWMISRGLFYPALGNHDWGYPWYPGFSAQKIPLLQALPYLPGNGRYYTIVLGNDLIRIFILDSDSREPDGREVNSIQGRWLKLELAKSTAKYNLIFFHEPPFSSCLFGNTAALDWPFQKWGADAVFSGHCHFYERIMKDEFPYFVNGLGGSREITPFESITEGSTVRFLDEYGAQLIEANYTRLTISFITIQGELIDLFVINGP